MKNVILLFVFLILNSCSRESSSEESQTQIHNRKINKVLISDTDGSLNTTEISFFYDKNNLIELHEKYKNGIIKKTTFNYENGKLSSVNSPNNDPNSKILFSYAGQKLTSIKYKSPPGYSNAEAIYNLTYDNDNKISKIDCSGYYPSNTVITNQISYNGSNISGTISKRNGVTQSIFTDISYDVKNSPLKNLPFEIKMFFAITAEYYGIFSPYNEILLSISDNNILNFKFAGQNGNLQTSTLNYEYDNYNFPIKAENNGYALGKVTCSFNYIE